MNLKEIVYQNRNCFFQDYITPSTTHAFLQIMTTLALYQLNQLKHVLNDEQQVVEITEMLADPAQLQQNIYNALITLERQMIPLIEQEIMRTEKVFKRVQEMPEHIQMHATDLIIYQKYQLAIQQLIVAKEDVKTAEYFLQRCGFIMIEGQINLVVYRDIFKSIFSYSSLDAANMKYQVLLDP